MQLLPSDLPTDEPRGARPRMLLLVVAIVCTILTTSTAATVYVASDASRRTTDERSRLVSRSADLHRQDAAVRALVDSLVAPLGELPEMDSTMLSYSVGFLSGGGHSDALIDFDSAAVQSLDTLGFLRQWARSRPLPAFWGYKPQFGGAGSASQLPVHSYSALRRFMDLNEAAADSALLALDPLTAMTHARETIAGARHLLAQPLLLDMVVARAMLRRGARLLVRAAQQADDPLTAGAARRLDTMSSETYFVGQPQFLAYTTLGELPRDGRLIAMAADTTLHPALRLEAFRGLLAGACLRPREMLFGLSDERRLAFVEMTGVIEDIPRARDVAALYARDLDDFDESPARGWNPEKRALQASKASALPLSWAIPRIVRDRVQACRMVI